MSTEDRIDAALEAVVTAARSHRAALRDGATEERIWRAYVALNNATVRYDDLISEVYDEVTPWDCEYLESDEEPPAQENNNGSADGASVMVTVRHRRDFVIPEPDRLLALASEARRASWAEIDTEHATRPVTGIGEAVNELVQAGDGTVAALDAYPEELVPGNGVLLVNTLHRPLVFGDPGRPELGGDVDPLALGPDEAQLYRMDEEVVDEDVSPDLPAQPVRAGVAAQDSPIPGLDPARW